MEDKNIVQLLWERAETGLEELHKKHGRFLYHLAFNLLSNREDSEECVNDGYLKTWNSIPPNAPDNLRLYTAKIVRNLALDRIKHRSAQKRNSSESILLSELEDCIPASETVESAYERQEIILCLNRFVKSLDNTDQYIFVHRYWLGDSLNEIAELTGLSENTLSGKLFRMRKKLKKTLEAQCL